jgi:hypothetical protein
VSFVAFAGAASREKKEVILPSLGYSIEAGSCTETPFLCRSNFFYARLPPIKVQKLIFLLGT